MTDQVSHNRGVPRRIAPEQFGRLLEVATQTFIARGYRRTQVADVALAIGVAKGTVYGYVQSKEALFDAALRFADGDETLPTFDALPLPTPEAGRTVSYVASRVKSETEGMVLPKVLGGQVCFADPRDELAAIIRDLLERLYENRFTIKLIDRCAADYPELAQAWFGSGRWEHHRLLVDLMLSRAATGAYRSFEAPQIVARTLIESIAFWGLHRHFDPSPQSVDEETMRLTLIDIFCRTLLKEPTS